MSDPQEQSKIDFKPEPEPDSTQVETGEKDGELSALVQSQAQTRTIKEHLYEIIFEADTAGGKAFDVVLLIMILGSVVVVMLDSVRALNLQYFETFRTLEWFFTIAFTTEYILRLYCSTNRMKYATSFFGMIDLLSILPTYLAIFLSGAQYMMIVRILRLLRLFRIFKLGRFLQEADTMIMAPQIEHTEDKRLSLFGDVGGDHCRSDDVSDRTKRERLHQHPQKHLLGSGDSDHCRLRRYRPPDRAWTDSGLYCDDSWIRYNRCPHRNCIGRDAQSKPEEKGDLELQ